MIVTIGGIKGGTGKTTLATNLTVMRSMEGRKVLLVDADEQKSSWIWADQRESLDVATKWTTITLGGKGLLAQVERMRADYDDIIIDVGGRETTSLIAAICASDVFIAPFKPRTLDLWSLENIISILAKIRQVHPDIRTHSVINQADFTGSDNDAARKILEKCEEITCLETTIGSRKAFSNAIGDGLGVVEMKVIDKKAVKEITELYDFIYNKTPVHV